MKKTPETEDQQAIEAAKEKRRSYARAYYAAHKDKLKDAVRRCRAKGLQGCNGDEHREAHAQRPSGSGLE